MVGSRHLPPSRHRDGAHGITIPQNHPSDGKGVMNVETDATPAVRQPKQVALIALSGELHEHVPLGSIPVDLGTDFRCEFRWMCAKAEWSAARGRGVSQTRAQSPLGGRVYALAMPLPRR